MSNNAAPVTPDELVEVMAREVPADLRLAGRMPGKTFKRFHDTEQTWTAMLEMGLIDDRLYKKALDSRFSFKVHLPARAAGDYIKGVAEAKNPTPMLAMVSQAVGAKRIGNDVVPIRREDVPGMDSRELMEVIKEPLVRKELSFEGGMEILEVLATKHVQEGAVEDDEMKEFLDAARHFKRMMKKVIEK